jgi:hypothetical protein
MNETSVLFVVGCLPPAPKMNRLWARLIHTINGTEVIEIHNVDLQMPPHPCETNLSAISSSSIFKPWIGSSDHDGEVCLGVLVQNQAGRLHNETF